MKSIEIFRAGKHINSQNIGIEFTNIDLKLTTLSYNENSIKAPLVLGHPKSDMPVYGYVDKLSLENGSLIAHINQISQSLVELVRAGSYKYVSASFYTPDSYNNPAKGMWYLKHVGFLGAMPPAVKGLKHLNFGESVGNNVQNFDSLIRVLL